MINDNSQYINKPTSLVNWPFWEKTRKYSPFWHITNSKVFMINTVALNQHVNSTVSIWQSVLSFVVCMRMGLWSDRTALCYCISKNYFLKGQQCKVCSWKLADSMEFYVTLIIYLWAQQRETCSINIMIWWSYRVHIEYALTRFQVVLKSKPLRSSQFLKISLLFQLITY